MKPNQSSLLHKLPEALLFGASAVSGVALSGLAAREAPSKMQTRIAFERRGYAVEKLWVGKPS
jgi:hypothetical protein